MAQSDNSASAGNRGTEGRVIPFPMAGQACRVRQTVERLMRANGNAADRFWKTTIAEERARMEAIGVSPAVIDEELRTFAKTVFARIHELHVEEARRGV